MEIGVLLCRVDILHLFHRLIKGPGGLDTDMAEFKEWEEFVRHFFRQVVKKVQERPELVVEMLFSKIPATIYFLEHGHDQEVPKRIPRPPAELEVKPGMEKEEQIGVAVGVLVNQNKSDALRWLREVLTDAAQERRDWEDMEEARKEEALGTSGEPTPQDPAPQAEQTPTSEPPKAPSIRT